MVADAGPWPAIAPELAGKVDAVDFDATTRTLHLRPATPAYRTELTFHQKRITAKVNNTVGPDTLQCVEILRPATLTTRPHREPPVTSSGRDLVLSEASLGHRRFVLTETAARIPPMDEESHCRAEISATGLVLARGHRCDRSPVRGGGDGRRHGIRCQVLEGFVRHRRGSAAIARGGVVLRGGTPAQRIRTIRHHCPFPPTGSDRIATISDSRLIT
ncbi:DciA family protein [Streptomyces clavifer]|uniref:DciA family protein n=1 Tax=Streptomyces TaxID=1883 RepID=UPI00099F3C27|nr:DciA family protein [Streptomyces sp. Root55]